jgi:hypothetical protein
MRAFVPRLAAALLVALASGRAVTAAPSDPPPDAEVLLNLDLLKETDLARDRDLLRTLSLVERLRLLEALKYLESQTPAAAPAQGPAGKTGR